jgi:hypothetical protein
LTSSLPFAIEACDPDDFGGSTMRTVRYVLVYLVLLCLLLTAVGGGRCFRSHAPSDSKFRRERHSLLARLRRCRDEHPDHHPVQPCKNTILPPDEDSADRVRPTGKSLHDRLLALTEEPRSQTLARALHDRPPPLHLPWQQTLCILLI